MILLLNSSCIPILIDDASEKLVQKHGGNLRYDLNPVKGKFLHPHVQIENLTPSIKSRHIWLGEDAIKYLQK